MKVNYKTLKNEKYTVTVPDDDANVCTLRQLIATDRGANPELIRIVFNGKALVDGKTLSDYNIDDDKTVVIIINTKPIPVTERAPVPPPQPVPSSLHPSGPPLPIIPPITGSQSVSNMGNLFNAQPPITQTQSVSNISNLFGGLGSGSNIGNLLNDLTTQTLSNTESGGNLDAMLNGMGMERFLSLMILNSMMNDPEMRQVIESNPGLALQIVSNPNFLRQILETPDDTTPLTEEEQAEIQELVEMGIPQADAQECYVMANKNKMVAANIFFSRD